MGSSSAWDGSADLIAQENSRNAKLARTRNQRNQEDSNVKIWGHLLAVQSQESSRVKAKFSVKILKTPRPMNLRCLVSTAKPCVGSACTCPSRGGPSARNWNDRTMKAPALKAEDSSYPCKNQKKHRDFVVTWKATTTAELQPQLYQFQHGKKAK